MTGKDSFATVNRLTRAQPEDLDRIRMADTPEQAAALACGEDV
jgi:hypothetical protein